MASREIPLVEGSSTRPFGSPEYAQLVQEIKNDAKEFLLVGAGT
jgi:hypothetical protein